jgi:ethanolamine permease
VIVVGIGGYLGAIFETPESAAPLWWLAAYAVFVAANVAGVALTFRLTVAVTLAALAILAVFALGALPHVDLARFALDVPPTPEGSAWLPFGWQGVLAALPFAIWFYLGIEELPLAAEEAHAPERDLPKGLVLGLATLIVCAFATLVIAAGAPPGAHALARTSRSRAQATGAGWPGVVLLAVVACRDFTASSSPTAGRSTRSRAPVTSRAGCR